MPLITCDGGIVVRYEVEAGGRNWIGIPEVMLPRCCWMGSPVADECGVPGNGASRPPCGRKPLDEEPATLEDGLGPGVSTKNLSCSDGA